MNKNELPTQAEVKGAWAKPELEMVSVKESTLAASNVGLDNGFFS